MSNVQQVEVVHEYESKAEQWQRLAQLTVAFGIRVLIIWWAVAAWFPEFGITYWQLVLPVYALRLLILPVTYKRILFKGISKLN